MSILHHEATFEQEICAAMSAHGWLIEGRDDSGPSAAPDTLFDTELGLFPADLVAWVQATQPKAWEALLGAERKRYADVDKASASAARRLADRVRKQIDARGTLDVLRNGVDITGVRKTVRLAAFRPETTDNQILWDAYRSNRLRLARQVRFCQTKETLDLVLAINGIPTATAELKTDLTQTIDDAIDQYRFDRDPKRPGDRARILEFATGALVHFAVSTELVRMTTKLQGKTTRFLPFDQGCNQGAGNPIIKENHRTAYLWQQVWAPDAWLDLIGRFLLSTKDKKSRGRLPTNLIFPRFHQWRGVRRLTSAVLHDGVGQSYLMQHSAGSGKTNSIAWTAHRFSDLHDATGNKVFDAVVVVSDRTVIDDQLREAILSFEKVKGVVEAIDGKSGSKTSAVHDALARGAKIIVCTLQTFPYALKALEEGGIVEGKRYAVIADEAHSSQAGESAAALKSVLAGSIDQEEIDDPEDLMELELAKRMKGRGGSGSLTFVAYTATPKPKTLELFGQEIDGRHRAFDVYSMRQAIEEAFILDVLQNYISYETAVRLADRLGGDTTVDPSRAKQDLREWLSTDPTTIQAKARAALLHFRDHVAHLMDGRAKAMIVASSRQAALVWKRAIEAEITAMKMPAKVLVAFSSDIVDIDGTTVSETHPKLNPGLAGRDIREVFEEPSYRLLIVANKFQTGFDQPRLCAMYVDRRLAGVQAVQTLARLNRCAPGKDRVYVVDFANNAEEVLAAHRDYYETAELAGATDPDLIWDLKDRVDDALVYDDVQVDAVVHAALSGATQGALNAALDPIVDEFRKIQKTAEDALAKATRHGDEEDARHARADLDRLDDLRSDMARFVRLYGFLSQLHDYGNTDLEKREILFRYLLRRLSGSRHRKEYVDLSGVTLTHHRLRKVETPDMALGGEGGLLVPASGEERSGASGPDRIALRAIIEKLNARFPDMTDTDLIYQVGHMHELMAQDPELRAAMNAVSSPSQIAQSNRVRTLAEDKVMEVSERNQAMADRLLSDESALRDFVEIVISSTAFFDRFKGGSGNSFAAE